MLQDTPAFKLWKPVYDAIRAEAERYEYTSPSGGIYTPSDFERLCLRDFAFGILDNRPFITSLSRCVSLKSGGSK